MVPIGGDRICTTVAYTLLGMCRVECVVYGMRVSYELSSCMEFARQRMCGVGQEQDVEDLSVRCL